jgi:hypothetical protein
MANALTRVLGANPALYSGEEVLLSLQQNVLYATSRYTEHLGIPGDRNSHPNAEYGSNAARLSSMASRQKPNAGNIRQPRQPPKNSRKQRRAPQSGYITAILLTPYVENQAPLQGRLVRAGFPIRVLLQVPTTTTGGLANSLSPADWGNAFFALADSQIGMIEVGVVKIHLPELIFVDMEDGEPR